MRRRRGDKGAVEQIGWAEAGWEGGGWWEKKEREGEKENREYLDQKEKDK